jgi:hypothetical protein
LVNIHGKLTRYGVVVAYRTLHRFAVQRCGFGSRRWTVLFSIYVVVPRLDADQHGGEVVEAVGDLECVVPSLFIHQECQEGNHAGEEDGNEGRYHSEQEPADYEGEWCEHRPLKIGAEVTVEAIKH